jgi:transcriptional regulator with PAS, ATPase and Fis domain
VAINCAALPSQILESELFGYTSGAFTGANKEGRLGLFEVAHGGTVFLDEVAEMDFTTQGKLLRVLQEKVVVRLGSDRVIPVDVRIIAATNKKLKSLVLKNEFRDDLYYRLNVLRLTLPPLRERRLDVAIYAQSFLSKYASALGRKITLSKSAIKWLEGYAWPGNIRELQNAMERTAAICKADVVDVTVLSQICEDEYKLPTMTTDSLSVDAQNILTAMSEANGKYTNAAKILGISRSTLWRKIRRLGLNI